MSNPYAPPSSGGRPAPAPTPPPTDGLVDDGSAPDPGSMPPPRPPGAPVTPPPPRPAPDPEAVRAASRRVLHFGLLMLASLVTASLALPWQAAGLAFALAAVVMGARAMRAVWRAGLRGALVPVLAIGLAFAAMLSASLATMLVLWPVQVERQDCLRDALTISAREACEQQFQDALTERLEQATRPAD